LVERSFAHCYETGGMRRCHLRGHENILKRQLVHVGAFNLSLILRKLLGAGTPRGICQVFCVNDQVFVPGVAVGFAVAVGFGDGLQGKGAVPLPLRPRRKELRCIMPTDLVWTFVRATAR
jgi:hypothetical protein